MNIKIIYVPFPNTETAKQTCKKLLEQKLIACANIIKGIESIYCWEGDIQVDNEVVAILKTTEKCIEKVTELVINEHPYETPAIIDWTANSANQTYSNWLQQSLNIT